MQLSCAIVIGQCGVKLVCFVATTHVAGLATHVAGLANRSKGRIATQVSGLATHVAGQATHVAGLANRSKGRIATQVATAQHVCYGATADGAYVDFTHGGYIFS